MAMGLCNGVATFQRLMEYILAGLNWQFILEIAKIFFSFSCNI
jgi:hypothetical protein